MGLVVRDFLEPIGCDVQEEVNLSLDKLNFIMGQHGWREEGPVRSILGVWRINPKYEAQTALFKDPVRTAQ